MSIYRKQMLDILAQKEAGLFPNWLTQPSAASSEKAIEASGVGRAPERDSVTGKVPTPQSVPNASPLARMVPGGTAAHNAGHAAGRAAGWVRGTAQRKWGQFDQATTDAAITAENAKRISEQGLAAANNAQNITRQVNQYAQYAPMLAGGFGLMQLMNVINQARMASAMRAMQGQYPTMQGQQVMPAYVQQAGQGYTGAWRMGR